MIKLRIFKFISTIFRLALIFAIAFIWTRYFFDSLAPSIMVAIGITLMVDMILFLIRKVRRDKETIKTSELAEASSMFYSLAISKTHMDFFYNLATTRHTARKYKEHIVVNSQTSKVMLIPFFSLNNITNEDIAGFYSKVKKTECTKLVIATGEVPKEVSSFASKLDFNIVLLDKNDTYQKLYKEYKTYPEISVKLKGPKTQTFKDLIAYSFNRKRTKHYFFAAALLLFSSLIVKNNLYYIITSSILLLFALISFYNPFFNKKAPQNIF